MLIYAGANVGAQTRIGQYTPLHIAAEGRQRRGGQGAARRARRRRGARRRRAASRRCTWPPPLATSRPSRCSSTRRRTSMRRERMGTDAADVCRVAEPRRRHQAAAAARRRRQADDQGHRPRARSRSSIAPRGSCSRRFSTPRCRRGRRRPRARCRPPCRPRASCCCPARCRRPIPRPAEPGAVRPQLQSGRDQSAGQREGRADRAASRRAPGLSSKRPAR